MAEAVMDIRALTFKDAQAGCLFAAVGVYALWGMPTPEGLGLPEIIAGVLLLAATGLRGGWQAIDFGKGMRWQCAGRALLAYGLGVPLFVGLTLGNSLSAILRDMIPFLFLLLPLFIYPLLHGKPEQIRFFTGLTAALGIAFAARVLLPYMMEQGAVPDPFRFANAPTVLFAGLFLMGLCGLYLYRGGLLKSAICFALALIPLAAMALIMQRASIGAFVLTVICLLGIGFVRRPRRMFLPLMLAALAVMAYWPVISEVVRDLLHKQAAVGLNMRSQEARAVMDAVGGSLWTVVLGKGWGASVASPAVGGAVVNFTHSLITTYWLKTGLMGLGFALFYLFRMGMMIAALLPRNPVMTLALAGPFAIDILLYASFKSLDFGLMLLLIPLWFTMPEKQQ